MGFVGLGGFRVFLGWPVSGSRLYLLSKASLTSLETFPEKYISASFWMFLSRISPLRPPPIYQRLETSTWV